MRYNELFTETQIVGLDHAIEHWMKGYRFENDTVKQWTQKKLKRYLATDYRGKGLYRITVPAGSAAIIRANGKRLPDWATQLLHQNQTVYAPNLFMDDNLGETLENILDWFDYLKTHNPPLYARLERMTFQDADRGQREWHEAVSKKQADEKIGEESGAVEVIKLRDGYRWVELTDAETLDTEGRRMGHCVGSYCDSVQKGHITIFSLRDAKNDPHVTVEARLPFGYNGHHYEINQIKGKGNEPPIAKYVPMINALIKTRKLVWGQNGLRDVQKMGLGMVIFDNEIMTPAESRERTKRALGKYGTYGPRAAG